MSPVLSEIGEGSYFNMRGHGILERNGYKYSAVISNGEFVVRVYDIRSSKSLVSNCISYLAYASNGVYNEKNIVKTHRGWAVLKECRA